MDFALTKDIAFHKLKKGIWLYFLLLIFEGALRKWALPSLAAPLLIVRDPIALYLLLVGISYGFFKNNTYVYILWGISFLSFVMTLVVGHGNMYVAIYGLRIMALHFPLIFVIAKVFDKNDVIAMGKMLLYIHIGMTLLVAVQFYSPQTAWVNRGIGGDTEGSGFGSTNDFFRVPGTFSFTNGLSIFYGLVAAFNLYFLIDYNNKVIPKWLLIASTVCLLAAIPLSISRTVFFEIILSFLFYVVVIARNPKMVGRLIIAGVFGVVAFFTLSNFSFFQTAVGAFIDRFTTANETEGGVQGVFLDRFLGGMVGALKNDDIPFFGKGIGMGTNVGAQILSGSRGFLVAEGEWGRLIGEMGLFLGLIVIYIRMAFVVYFAKYAWKAIAHSNFLPWMLLSFVAANILQGQWAQPTSLGFSVIGGGLLLASLNTETD